MLRKMGRKMENCDAAEDGDAKRQDGNSNSRQQQQTAKHGDEQAMRYMRWFQH
jgi:hypothetical protein